jgi:hypothetical protein
MANHRRRDIDAVDVPKMARKMNRVAANPAPDLQRMIVRAKFASPLKDLLDEAPPSLDELLRVHVTTKRRVNVELRVVPSERLPARAGLLSRMGAPEAQYKFQTRGAERLPAAGVHDSMTEILRSQIIAGESRSESGVAPATAWYRSSQVSDASQWVMSNYLPVKEPIMTTHAAPTQSTALRSRLGPVTAPAAAGVAFVAAWATGLVAWPSNLSVAASGTKVLSAYAGHQGAAITQYLLVEGAAAIALMIVVMALGRAAIRRGSERPGRVVLLAGISAAIVSLVECALGLVLSAGAGARRRDGPGRAGTLFHLINRIDGVKMLALAAMALAAFELARRGALVPRWLGYVSAVLSAAMTASAVGYLLLDNTLTQAAALSLGLLLIWVAATGIIVGRGSR